MKRIINLEIALGSDNPTILIGDVSQLRDKSISAISMYNADQVALCPDSGATVISAENSKNLFLTLKENGSEILKCIPANKLNPALNNGILFALNGQQIDWTESKVFAKGSISASSAFMVIEYAE